MRIVHFGKRVARKAAPRTREQYLTLIGAVVFSLAMVLVTVTLGLPVKRRWMTAWVVFALLCFGLGSMRRTLRDLLIVWVPLFSALFAYDYMRGQADSFTARAALGPHLDFDRALFGDSPGAILQRYLFDPVQAHWYDYFAWVVYQSHFFAPLVVALVLWRMRSYNFRPYIAGFILLTYMGLATYAIYPAQPPWMASQSHHTGKQVRVVQVMWKRVGVQRAASAFSTKPKATRGKSAYSNPVAALPSLHAAFPMLILLFVWGAARRWQRALLVLYVGSMAFALMYGAEHYLFDILMGWAYAAAAFVIVRAVNAARANAARAQTRPQP